MNDECRGREAPEAGEAGEPTRAVQPQMDTARQSRSQRVVASTAGFRLPEVNCCGFITGMSAQEIIEQIKQLSPVERAQVTRFVVDTDDSWIPDEFKEAMRDAEAGRLVDMETALRETPPTHLRCHC